ncbi:MULTISPECIES: ABC-three component system middle component 4 [Priestia]|uniref:ABC-three component system middle component 4 n=1 Tax=Priestia TaxID=2800373 RepID=UPI002E1A8EDE|nr:hypothetical protein [Priestia aryabhattai]
MIVDSLSYSSKGNPILDAEKISIFEFLIKYPYILSLVIKSKESKNLDANLKLYQEEVGNIESLFPNSSFLNEFSSVKMILSILVSYNLVGIDVQKNKKDIFFVVNQEGKTFINNLNEEYIVRMKELCNSLLTLRSVKNNELKKMINPLIKGV